MNDYIKTNGLNGLELEEHWEPSGADWEYLDRDDEVYGELN